MASLSARTSSCGGDTGRLRLLGVVCSMAGGEGASLSEGGATGLSLRAKDGGSSMSDCTEESGEEEAELILTWPTRGLAKLPSVSLRREVAVTHVQERDDAP
jgi:hypothetical protein